MQVEVGYANSLPKSIDELEQLELNMTQKLENSEIDFHHFNHSIGGQFSFQKLKKERRYFK